ncbi:MAG TPA: hypothetical protein VJ809_06305 [Pirellulales bacterium]|jgi:uncharacterized membrane protein|nr:hypothetical protein [Pirellulales bacterium]
MSKSRWLNEVAQALRRQRLPRAYIRRFTEELADHFDDSYDALSQEKTGMDAETRLDRLGAPDEIARRAAYQLRQRTYAGRHPFVTFVAAPLPAAALLLIGSCIPFLLILTAVPEDYAPGEFPAWAAAVMQTVVWAMRFVPFAAGAVLFCYLAERAFCKALWSFIACALVAMLAGLFAVQLTLPTGASGSGSLMMGFALPFGFAHWPAPFGSVQWLQALAPLAVWLVFFRRELAAKIQLA